MDLKKEFSDAREEHTSDWLQKVDIDEVKTFVRYEIVPKLRGQKSRNPNLNYYCVTFYVVETITKNGYVVICNTNASIGCDASPEAMAHAHTDIGTNILEAATLVAKRWNINPVVFEEKGMTAYRFEIRLF